MELFRNINFDFIGNRRWPQWISITLVLLSIGLLVFKGLNLGLEFTGGTQIELQFATEAHLDDIREILDQHDLTDVQLQHYGSRHNVLVRLPYELKQQDLGALLHAEVREKTTIGAAVGEQLIEQGALGILVAIIATMIYITMRFEYRFALSAAIALTHDILLILGTFALFAWEFDLAALAAVLAILGYSLNDTIVVFDRVRENFRVMRKGSVREIMNASINQTLSRTIMTSVLTLVVVVALLIYGGTSLFAFSIAMCLGVVVGTYSSIYVAGALAFSMGLTRKDLLARPKSNFHDPDVA
ncbi:MAG: protein translocase subunit SecF [Thiotrichales bacterium]|nr:MAG: protein translocase subunit SecF [Thiotrichales bacterium]